MAALITLVDGTVPVAADFNANFQALNSETRPATSGGTGQSTYVTGDLLYSSNSNVLSRLAAGSTGTTLTMTAGVPAWGAGNAGGPSVLGFSGANNVATPTSKYDMLAAYVTLRNPTTGSVRTVLPTTLTNDIAAATTVNGRDQAAAFTTSSWIYMYYVGTGSGAPTTLSSASATGPTLLTNQTEWALASAVFQDATPKILLSHARGSWIFWDGAQTVLATGHATSETAVSVATSVPPIALKYELQVTYNGGTDTSSKYRAVSGTANLLDLSRFATNGYLSAVFPNVAQQFLYQTGATAGGDDVMVLGFQLPTGDA